MEAEIEGYLTEFNILRGDIRYTNPHDGSGQILCLPGDRG